jgi:predicted DNA-binding protein (UPF0251 family)
MRNIQTVELSKEEIEAYRLRYIKNLDQNSAAKEMNTSTSTYQRIIDLAYKKIADALINGKAIKIVNNFK